ncbi:MAG: DUF1972 domain-containing protein [Eubacteriales bacterium]|nr:DUF1972 domain-containing protein [Eubacteriales bacterium]
MQHVFIVGAKGFTYGGYETFIDKLTEYHQNIDDVKYHIACKANGSGLTDETKLKGVKVLSSNEYEYHNAHCFKIKSPDIGKAQAILYDVLALKYCITYIKTNKIEHPIIYVLSSRVGPFMGYFTKQIHKLGGQYYNNPDGRESLRSHGKYVKKYWELSERGMVKHSDLVICDSKNIEKYIKEKYEVYNPKTIFIAYGSEIKPSGLRDDDEKYQNWIKKHDISPFGMFTCILRCVRENNIDIIVREYMMSNTKKDLVIITNQDEVMLKEMEGKYHYSTDKRIKFVGTVYDQELLKKIRENAYGYIHGHSVGGTNPSLLEALGSTKLNLLFDVEFNREVAEDAAFYWNKTEGNLSKLIDGIDKLKDDCISKYGNAAQNRVKEFYSWEFISNCYYDVWLNQNK